MSVEEDVELRDLIAQTLESNGSLAKIRAQLRASVYLALEEDVKVSKKQPLLNNRLKSYQKTAQGKAAFCLVREFLDFFNLDFTVSVYEPESYSGSGYKYEGRQKLLHDLGISELDLNFSGPVLMQLLNIAQNSKMVSSENVSKDATSMGDASFSNGDMNGTSHDDDDDDNEASKSETDSNSLMSNSSNIVFNKNDINKLKSSVEISPPPDHLKQTQIDLEINIPRVNLNETFDVSSSMTGNSGEFESRHSISNSNDGKLKSYLETILSPQSLNSTKEETDEEGTHRCTDSVTEDQLEEKESSYEGSSKTEKDSKNSLTKSNSDNENSCPLVKDIKAASDDRPKLSPPKSEKLKTKSNLSSLSDLPPLPLGKSRMSDILPSPYNKEFKERTNLKEVDEMFDMQDEYEEDFTSTSEIDLSSSSGDPKGSLSHTGKLSNSMSKNSSDKSQGSKKINSDRAYVKSKNSVSDKNNAGNSTTSVSEILEKDSDDSRSSKKSKVK